LRGARFGGGAGRTGATVRAFVVDAGAACGTAASAAVFASFVGFGSEGPSATTSAACAVEGAAGAAVMTLECSASSALARRSMVRFLARNKIAKHPAKTATKINRDKMVRARERRGRSSCIGGGSESTGGIDGERAGANRFAGGAGGGTE
jgi:hypothetical protein